MVGVIIAAGKGERLSKISKGIPKTLLKVKGKAMIQWIVEEATEAGVDNFIIITGFQNDRIKEYFEIEGSTNIKLVYNPHWERDNGLSVLTAEQEIDGEDDFLVMMSDHLIGREVIKGILKTKGKQALLAVEVNLQKVFDIKDATKVFIEDEEIISIGKNIKYYNGVDAGIFRLNKTVFKFLKKGVEQGKESLTEGIEEMMKEQKLCPFYIPEDSYWIDVDSGESYSDAKKKWRRK